MMRWHAGNGVTQHDAAGVLAQMVGSGRFTRQAVAMVSRNTARMREFILLLWLGIP
ncbi:phage tail tape measure protein [Salmonella enterica]|nr:phage tail tape measure protein [Salmonella enterica]EGH9933904.1 phage tail tape measure protein [Salmonella enterica]EGM0353589.1 phage tail tape measure protein [Salmonella enterica]